MKPHKQKKNRYKTKAKKKEKTKGDKKIKSKKELSCVSLPCPCISHYKTGRVSTCEGALLRFREKKNTCEGTILGLTGVTICQIRY
jgi:hypothetical protein